MYTLPKIKKAYSKSLNIKKQKKIPSQKIYISTTYNGRMMFQHCCKELLSESHARSDRPMSESWGCQEGAIQDTLWHVHLLKASFSSYKITHKTLKWLPYIPTCYCLSLSTWFILLDKNNFVKDYPSLLNPYICNYVCWWSFLHQVYSQCHVGYILSNNQTLTHV